MALVAYDYSSEEEIKENEKEQNELHQSGSCVLIAPANNTQPEVNINNKDKSLFSSLPPPIISTKVLQIEETDDAFLYKKEVPIEKPIKRVQISIPSLSGYSSDEEERPLDKKTKKSVCGLFAILPPPKLTPLSNTSFVPNVVQKKAQRAVPKKASKKKEPTAPSVKKPPTATLNKLNGYCSDSNDDEDIEIPETYDDETWEKICGRKKKVEIRHSPERSLPLDSENTSVVSAPEVEKPYSGLDNKAFKELIGSNKRIPQNIKLIDIHEDTIRPDKQVWLKSLTDPNFEAEAIIEEPVDNTRKARNHITALAEKALANDKELQLRWSENRYNRKQTQAKYGF